MIHRGAVSAALSDVSRSRIGGEECRIALLIQQIDAASADSPHGIFRERKKAFVQRRPRLLI